MFSLQRLQALRQEARRWLLQKRLAEAPLPSGPMRALPPKGSTKAQALLATCLSLADGAPLLEDATLVARGLGKAPWPTQPL